MCPPNYCGANGVCVEKNGSPFCNCNTGYVGGRCQLDDPCIKKPCNSNGACFPVVQTNTVNGVPTESVRFYCQCYAGFSGPTCSTGIIYSFLCSSLFLSQRTS